MQGFGFLSLDLNSYLATLKVSNIDNYYLANIDIFLTAF